MDRERKDVTIYVGADQTITWLFLDADCQPIDMSTGTYVFVIRPDPLEQDETLRVAATGAADGVVSVDLTRAQTLLLGKRADVYDLVSTTGGEVAYPRWGSVNYTTPLPSPT